MLMMVMQENNVSGNYPTSDTSRNTRRRIDALERGRAIFAAFDSTATNEAIDQQLFYNPQQAAAATDESSSGYDMMNATRGGGRTQVTRGGGDGSKTKTTTKVTTRRACGFCNSIDPGHQACSRCRQVVYCSKECQLAHWKKGHKQACVTVEDRKPNPPFK
jgi:hypothetical protein